MSQPDDNSNHGGGWIDRELRRVPVPDGLLARLREVAAHGADEALDEQLCAVPVPEGLEARLRLIVDDEKLDRRLAEVVLPDGLMARLRQIPADELLDEAIRDVPTPAEFVPSLAAAVRRQAVPSELIRWAVAASVFLAVGASYFGGLSRLAAIVAGAGASEQSLAKLAARAKTLPAVEVPTLAAADASPAAAGGHAPAAEVPVDRPARPLLAESDLWPDAAGGGGRFGREALRSADAEHAERLMAQVATRLRPADLDLDAAWRSYLREGIITHPVLDEAPPLETALPVVARGILPPVAVGFDRVALARTGVHPFVNPGSEPRLETAKTPLVTKATSFDQLWQRLHDDRGGNLRPLGSRARPEDFLAAIDYRFLPPSNGALAIRTAAGPSPFAGATSGLRLMQIAVQGKTLERAARSPVHLTLAVDVSRSMGFEGRLVMVREGLASLAAQLRTEDRVSLVIFGDRSEVVLENVDRADDQALAAAIASLAAQRATNFGGGLELAAAVSRRTIAAENGKPLGLRRAILIFADAPRIATEAQKASIRRLLENLASEGIRVSMADLSLGLGADEQLSNFAAAAHGKVQTVDSAREVHQATEEVLLGRSSEIAADVEMTVRFNPKAVARYRLVGHEATLGLPTAPLKATLRSGDAATALFEVVLKADGTNDVATVNLEWTDAVTSKHQTLSQPISRVQFANSLAESPMSLQAAAVAAEAAEVLRGSRAGVAGHSLDRTLEVARSVHPKLREQADFQRLVALIEAAKQAGLGR
jgi:Ca-activated chloride channel family protein